jgi:hypothetical protein
MNLANQTTEENTVGSVGTEGYVDDYALIDPGLFQKAFGGAMSSWFCFACQQRSSQQQPARKKYIIGPPPSCSSDDRHLSFALFDLRQDVQ